MCPVFLARGEGEVLRDQQEALACRMKQARTPRVKIC